MKCYIDKCTNNDEWACMYRSDCDECTRDCKHYYKCSSCDYCMDDDVETNKETSYTMNDSHDELLSLHNIIKDGDSYKLQNNYYKDGDRIVPVIRFEDRDDHNCCACSHFNSMGAYDGHCDIYNRLLNLPEHHIVWASSVINCAAYDKIEKMNIINSLDKMIAFIEKTENFFGCPEAYEEYYGFERNWNEETGEILETVREYHNRGGVFENIPTAYPCVIRFDYGDRDGLEWIYIGE